MREDNLEELIKNSAPHDSKSPEAGFKRALRFQLDKEISKLSKVNPTINHFSFMNKLKFVLPVAGVALAAVILFVSMPKDEVISLPGKQEITRINEHAYGELNSINTLAAGGRGQGGGGGGNASLSADAKMIAPSETTGSPESLIYPYPIYKYAYKGEEFTVDSDKMDVYERQKGFGSNVDLGSFLKKFSVGVFDIAKFKNASLDYIRASENREEGYALDMDLKAGTVYIGQNWERWAMVDYSSQMKPEQLPSDEAAINTANQFLDEYGITRENYGTPEVQNSWRVMYEKAVDKSSIYVPDSVTVVYPAKVSGNEIYDESGNKSGMYVYINARTNKVSSVGEITGQRYNSSQYETEKDTKRLIGIAENGGYRSYLPFAAEGIDQPNSQVQTIELGTPKIVYVRMWQTLNNESKDLYVPSLMFPIISKNVDIYQQSISVPLIKEMLDNQNSGGLPMPMTKSSR